MGTNRRGIVKTAIALATRTSDAEHNRDNENESGRRTTRDDVRDVGVNLF